MEDKRTFREVFNFFVKYRDLLGKMDREAFWDAAAKEMGHLCSQVGNTPLAIDMFAAVYEELARRDGEREAQRQRC